jgi:pyruvate formate lyase activating enzyme
MNNLTALISNLQHFSTGDGPGIRSAVFFQGCNLHCEWCHNPEAIPKRPVLLLYRERCTGCGRCTHVCPVGAHGIGARGHTIDRSRCILCGRCAENCPSDVLRLSGRKYTLGEVLQLISEDMDFYIASGGGVTLSGGEPLLQADFCEALAKECVEREIPVLVETAGNVGYAAFQTVLPFVSQFYYDLKGTNEEDYREKTGGSFQLTMENLTRLVSDGADVTARIPIIPGYNDSIGYCRMLADILQPTGVKTVHLLPFHRLGSSKYRAMDSDYRYQSVHPPTTEKMNELLSIFSSGFSAKLDG